MMIEFIWESGNSYILCFLAFLGPFPSSFFYLSILHFFYPKYLVSFDFFSLTSRKRQENDDWGDGEKMEEGEERRRQRATIVWRSRTAASCQSANIHPSLFVSFLLLSSLAFWPFDGEIAGGFIKSSSRQTPSVATSNN
jgi:hypothetical protein